MYPGESPAAITSITLTVAFFNSLSGSFAYWRQKRIDFKSAFLFAITAVPGAILGAYLVDYISRGTFQYIFGSVLLVVAIYIVLRPHKTARGAFFEMWKASRKITDAKDNIHEYCFNLPLGMTIAFFVGVLSGLLGIGGGIIHVPALTQLLSFPTHIATATSHFTIVMTTFAAIITHIAQHTFTADVGRALVLSAGAFIGAQFGAVLSQKISGIVIVRLLALGLTFVAIRLLVSPV